MSFLLPLIIIASYCFTILWIRWNWVNSTKEPTKKMRPKPLVSVVIAFKNERVTLSILLTHLQNQTFSKSSFEVIVVNDHSTDSDYQWLTQYDVKLILASNNGKKAALHQGITAAKGDFIVTTDADCLPSPNWLTAMVYAYQTNTAAMIMGPVTLCATKKSFFQGFQMMDFMALQLSGAGAAMGKRPVFCNGANLGFTKEAWSKAINIQVGNNFASGDDVFLLHAFKKLQLKILYLKDKRALVKTQPARSWQQFLHQRVRWGGKSKGYNDVETLFLAFVVFSTNLLLVFSTISTLWNSSFWWLLTLSFILKYLADVSLLKTGQSFFDYRVQWLPFLVFSLIYPFYLVYTALTGLLCKEKWRNK